MFTNTEHVSPPIQKKPRTEGGKERGTTRIQTQALPPQRSFPYCPYAVSEKLVLSQVRERVRVQESLGGGGEGAQSRMETNHRTGGKWRGMNVSGYMPWSLDRAQDLGEKGKNSGLMGCVMH